MPAMLSTIDRLCGFRWPQINFRIQRIVLSAFWSESVAEPDELFLVNAVQHLDGRPLDYFVFQGGHRKWALSSVGLWYVRSARR
jgi:hypothetical protein